nr:MAG TPA: HTH-type transcriptional regulator [Bacteriophage sp.]
MNKIVKINGKIYNSIKEASESLNISCTTLRKHLNKCNKHKPIKYKNLICEYVNQQPSTSLNDL